LSPELLAGGRYTVERTLGGGGMAVVYLALDRELDRPVAIKVLAGHVLGDEAFRERFVREARMAARLSHPNVVSIYDTGEDDGRPFIVMEYVEGETLAEFGSRRERVPPGEVVNLALQICGGLEHAHEAGLVHRDVKPQNLLVRGQDGVVKIADFGIARSAEATQLTQAGTVLGTAAYLAPEQAAGGEVSPATDLYSLGAVLYELLTGRPPYRFESLIELAFKQQEQAVEPVREHAPEVPEPLEDVVMRCLARNPAYRPESAAALARELAAASPEPPTRPLPLASETKTVPLRRPSRPPRRRDRRVLLALAAAAAVLAIVTGLALAARDDPGGSSPPTTPAEPAPPEDRARDLAEWLREHQE
jgi:serine/threonine-protein kinase